MGDIAFKTLGGDGRDIVLIHGFGSDRLSWLGNSPALMPLGRVHALDLPGHGDSRLDIQDVRPRDLAETVARQSGTMQADLLTLSAIRWAARWP